jgi:hypothetical protein
MGTSTMLATQCSRPIATNALTPDRQAMNLPPSVCADVACHTEITTNLHGEPQPDGPWCNCWHGGCWQLQGVLPKQQESLHGCALQLAPVGHDRLDECLAGGVGHLCCGNSVDGGGELGPAWGVYVCLEAVSEGRRRRLAAHAQLCKKRSSFSRRQWVHG